MKTLLTISVLLFSGFIYGQGIKASTYMEYTSVSPKAGTSLSYFFKDQIEVGGFYQKSTVEIQREEGRPLCAEVEFFGAYFGYPLMVTEKSKINFDIRTGVTNGQNFTITPSISLHHSPIKFISLGVGVGVRSFKPTGVISISFLLNNQGKSSELLAINE